MRTRYEATIVGLAIGDALGWPTEFLSLSQIHAQFGAQGLSDLVPLPGFAAGTYTDDTQMTLAVAEGLLDAAGGGLDEQMTAVAHRFVHWAASPDNNRAPGVTCLTACQRLRELATWRESGVDGSKGCGSAMRSAPVGLLYHRDSDRLIEVADATGLITHRHPTARAGSVATALAVSLALDNTPPPKILEQVIEVGGRFSSEFAKHLARVPAALALPPREALSGTCLGDRFIAEDVLAAAMYAFLRTPEDYRTTVLCAANSEGDSDSIACIAGAISGAYNGLDAIPARWCAQIENRDGLLSVAGRLHDASSLAVAG